MEEAINHIPSLVFFIIGTITVASSILVVAMRNPVHSALFLLVAFVCVAIIFIMLGAEFVGAVQLLVYAGGIMVLFLFVVMLINVRDIRTQPVLSPYWKGGIAVGLGLFILLAAVVKGGVYHEPVNRPKALRTVTTIKHTKSGDKTIRKVVGNSEAIGMALYRDYLVPFEVASVFLLVAMIGAIVIGKRDLLAEEEEATPDFIIDRAAQEKRVKGAFSA